MSVRKSLALAVAVSGSAAPALAADWSGPYGGLSAGGGFGDQAQHGGILVLPSSGGMTPPVIAPTTSVAGSTTTVTTSSLSMSSSMFSSTPISTGTFPTSTSSASADGHYHMAGGLVGGAVGYNFQFGNYVLGVEGSGAWADISGRGTCGVGSALPHRCGGEISALGTVRGRAGYDLGLAGGPFSGMLVFASGGLAVAEVRAWDNLYNTKGSKTLAGWTVGGGVEAMLAQHWSIAIEYLHIDLGDQKVFTAIPPISEKVRTNADVFQIGVRYRFF